jgi:hypothetical protein
MPDSLADDLLDYVQGAWSLAASPRNLHVPGTQEYINHPGPLFTRGVDLVGREIQSLTPTSSPFSSYIHQDATTRIGDDRNQEQL